MLKRGDRLWRRWGGLYCGIFTGWSAGWALYTLLTHGSSWAAAIDAACAGLDGGLLVAWRAGRTCDHWQAVWEVEMRSNQTLLHRIREGRWPSS